MGKYNTIGDNELNGKVVKLIVQESENVKMLCGQDIDTEKIYVLRIDVKDKKLQ